jgi:hypothetical protein
MFGLTPQFFVGFKELGLIVLTSLIAGIPSLVNLLAKRNLQILLSTLDTIALVLYPHPPPPFIHPRLLS